MTTQIRVGLLGCGVVGGGVVEALHRNAEHMEAQFGVRLELVRVVVRDVNRPRTPHFQPKWLASDWRQVTEASDIDIVIEAMGGISPAREAIKSALRFGKHVVTANKELLARHGEELLALARETGQQLLFEASVLGGIPALHALQTYFGANRITRLRGIFNGTTNYILSRMTDAPIGFAQALEEAQAAGYAEADPTSDVEGYDALYKLKILIRQAFAAEVRVGDVEQQGISRIEAADMVMARNLDCKIKLVAEASWDPAIGRVTAAVRPVLLGSKDTLYSVDGVQNALAVTGDLVGDLVFMGPGAGAFPTASAVVEDLVKIALTSSDRVSQSSASEVAQVTSSEYIVRRKCDCGVCTGAQYNAAISQALDGAEIRYLNLPEHGQESWIVRLKQALTTSEFEHGVYEVLKGTFSSFPIYGLSEEAFQYKESEEVAG